MVTVCKTLVALSAAVAAVSSTAQAVLVDAGVYTTVDVDTSMYDTRLVNDGGCDPSGCVGDLTRDGDLSADSRWSCSRSLSSSADACSITYTLGDYRILDSINIALHKGDERTVSMRVYCDGVFLFSWTSSGTTTGFENIYLGGGATEIKLIGALALTEWLSITEVQLLEELDDAQPPSPSIAEAPVFSIDVYATASYYDDRPGTDGGCEPDGCLASNTVDDLFTDASRWSCKPSLGGANGECSLALDVGAVYPFMELRLAFSKGNERTRTVDVFIDQLQITTFTSSGTAPANPTSETMEIIDISGGSPYGCSGQVVTVVGDLDDDEWLSIIEAEIWILYDGSTRKLMM